MVELELNTTKNGVASIWEQGGFDPESKQYYRTVITADSNVLPKKPLFVSYDQQKFVKHALFPINIGDLIGIADVDGHLSILKVKKIRYSIANSTAICDEMGDVQTRAMMADLVTEKRNCRNCRHVHYAEIESEV